MSALTKDLLLEGIERVEKLLENEDHGPPVPVCSFHWLEVQRELLKKLLLVETVRAFIEIDDQININGRDLHPAHIATLEETREKLFEKMRKYTE